MEMHRVQVLARVHHAPAHGVAGGIREPLGVRPRQPVDREQSPAPVSQQRILCRVLPRSDDEHAIVCGRRARCRRIDDERARELRVRAARHHRGGGRRAREVEVCPHGTRGEANVACLARREHERVGGAIVITQAPHHRAHIEKIVYGHAHLRARRNSKQRAGNRRVVSGLGERLHGERDAEVAIGEPRGVAELEGDGEGVVGERASRCRVVVRVCWDDGY